MTDGPDHSIRVRVYLEDTDAGGIAYHASYLRFMERARTEWLRALGLEQSQTFGLDVSFVVHSMALRFARPARLDDELVVSCCVSKARAASLTFEQRVSVVGAGEPGATAGPDVCCSADVTVACIRLSTGRATRIPKQIIGKAKP